MTNKNDIVDDVRNLLEYAKSLGMTEVTTKPSLVARRSSLDTTSAAKSEDLKKIRAEIGDCKRCKLCKGRKNIVFGVGNPDAKLMFIGEGPGADEDLQGIPFVGRAGQLLTKIIEAMNFKRGDVYIGNIVKCLRYNAMVQLGNGRWERIGRLVRRKFEGTVKSVDSHGKIVKKRVIGWHETNLGSRSVYKLTYKSAKATGLFKCAIYLTGDHPVLTEKGYIAVQDLKSHDRIATGQGLKPTTKKIIYGMLLGDGHINSKQSHLSFSHSIKQEEYAKFKLNLLKKELGSAISYFTTTAGKDKRYKIVSCRTLAHRSLRIIRNDFYSPKKHVPLWMAENLDPLTLAIWFLDDGYMRIRPGRKPLAEIATCAFSISDLKILLKGLKKLGLSAHILRNRLYFDVKESKILSAIIAPYVPNSMRWKLDPEIASVIPFSSKFLARNEKPEVFYDKVEFEPVIHKGTDKTFFCIDVEDTNNFVTTGGVVHNCRPPGNRNPEPDEVKACIPFLIKQAEVIAPEIIVCLGSVATQNLLNTEEKITKLRGNFTEWQNIPVMPTYHPAFLLRNPNMKKPVWEDMQKVMEAMGKAG